MQSKIGRIQPPLNSAIEAIVQREMKRGGNCIDGRSTFQTTLAIIDEWRAGGEACGVVWLLRMLRSSRTDCRQTKTQRWICSVLFDYIDRIREIQFEMVRLAEKSGWVVIDVTKSNDPIGEIFLKNSYSENKS